MIEKISFLSAFIWNSKNFKFKPPQTKETKMVLLLNLVPPIIFGTAGWFIAGYLYDAVYRKITIEAFFLKSIRTAVIALVALVIFTGLTNGYIPKNPASKTGVPIAEFEVSKDTIQDRLRKPELTREEREQRFNEKMEWRR